MRFSGKCKKQEKDKEDTRVPREKEGEKDKTEYVERK